MTRALSGLSVVAFPKAKNSGLAAAFSDEAQKQAVVVCYGRISCTGGRISGRSIGNFCWRSVYLCAAVVVYGYYYRMSIKNFGGIIGDLAGYFLQVCELTLLPVMAITVR